MGTSAYRTALKQGAAVIGASLLAYVVFGDIAHTAVAAGLVLVAVIWMESV